MLFTKKIPYRHPCLAAFVWLMLICSIVASGVHAAEPLIDINSASASLMAEKLPGIGPKKAKAIVAYRSQYGAFKTLSALTEVKGIGARTLEKIRALLVIKPDSSRIPELITGAVGAAGGEVAGGEVAGSEVAGSEVTGEAESRVEKSRANVMLSTDDIEAANTRAVRAVVNIARQQGESAPH